MKHASVYKKASKGSSITPINFFCLFPLAAPRATIDLNTETGAQIPIEDRPSAEITLCKCSQKTLISPKSMCTIIIYRFHSRLKFENKCNLAKHWYILFVSRASIVGQKI